MKARRADDGGWLCQVALRAGQFWDFIDRRQIDAYLISFVILWESIVITHWAMDYAVSHPEVDGIKAAAIIAAITVPWGALQAAAIKFLFDARKSSFVEVQKAVQ